MSPEKIKSYEQLTFTLPVADAARLRTLAAREDRKIAWVVRKAVLALLNSEVSAEPETAGPRGEALRGAGAPAPASP